MTSKKKKKDETRENKVEREKNSYLLKNTNFIQISSFRGDFLGRIKLSTFYDSITLLNSKLYHISVNGGIGVVELVKKRSKFNPQNSQN